MTPSGNGGPGAADARDAGSAKAGWQGSGAARGCRAAQCGGRAAEQRGDAGRRSATAGRRSTARDAGSADAGMRGGGDAGMRGGADAGMRGMRAARMRGMRVTRMRSSVRDAGQQGGGGGVAGQRGAVGHEQARGCADAGSGMGTGSGRS